MEQPVAGTKQTKENQAFIDTAGNKSLADVAKAKWAWVSIGINGDTISHNETNVTHTWMDGTNSQETQDKRRTDAFTGVRFFGDAAQEFVASHADDTDSDLHTLFAFRSPDGKVKVGVIAMSNIVEGGGTAGAEETFSFTANWLYKPVLDTGNVVKLPTVSYNGGGDLPKV